MRGVTMEGGLQTFFNTCQEVVVEDSLSEAEVRDELNDVVERLESFDGSDLPSTGEVGQAKAGMRATIKSLQWLLGEYDGEYDVETND